MRTVLKSNTHEIESDARTAIFQPAIVDATYFRIIAQRIKFAEIEIQNTFYAMSRESEIFIGKD